VWTFGGLAPPIFWARRQANETSVHRWDAEMAAFGKAAPIDAALARDGVEEVLEFFLPIFKKPGNGETFHFHRTDGDGEWLVTATADGPAVERKHGKGDLALRGSASDLVLFLWRRIPADRLEIFGNPALVDRWFEIGGLS
jgi:predicted lipid carrier protein YhbT